MKASVKISLLVLNVILLTTLICGPIAAQQLVPAPNPQGAKALEIQSIEVNQGLGVQLNGALKLVAGKETVIRAFLSEDTRVDAAQTRAVIKRDGADVATLAPKAYDAPTKVVDFLCPSLGDCGNWAAGSYWFEVTVNGVSKNTEGTAYNFQERAEVRVLALAVKANFSGTISVPTDIWKTMDGFTRRVYPVAGTKFKWDVREEFDATKWDMDTDAGRAEVWQALTNLLPAQCASNPKGQGCYDLIVGFISQNPKHPVLGALAGFTMGKPTNIVVATDEDAPMTVAHEIAHVYGVGDTYEKGSLRCSVNPAPDSFIGKDWDDRSKDTKCTQGRVPLEGVSATKIPADQHPYDIGGRGALPDMACYMGAGGRSTQFWTTQEVYNYLFDQLAPSAPTAAALADPQRLLYYLGYLGTSGTVTKEPWEAYMDTDVMADTTGGTYMIKALDAGGNTLASQNLDVQFYPLASPGQAITKIDPAPFEGAIRFPAETTKFQIISGTEVLSEVPVSANAPVVSAVTPTSTMTITGEYTIAWTASDADGDAMTYTVEYNPDVVKSPEGWMILAGDITEMQYAEDFSQLPGGAHAQLRVIATDGILTGQAESAEFIVPFKPPEVFIEPPAEGTSYEVGEDIYLQGEAIDLQDDQVAEENLQWRSNLSGTLGTGSEIVVSTLPMGEHIITLMATNSAGLTATASITLRVGNVTREYIAYPATDVTRLTNDFGGLNTTVEIPAGAVYSDTLVTFESKTQPFTTTVPSGLTYAGRAFSLDAQVLEGEDWKSVSFAVPAGVTVTLDYPALPQGMRANSLRLMRLDNAGTLARWVDAATECNPAGTYDLSVAGKLTVRVCHFGEFALVGSGNTTVYLPLVLKTQ